MAVCRLCTCSLTASCSPLDCWNSCSCKLRTCRSVALSSLLLLQIPIYAHVKEVVDPEGRREALEINYMTFLAYNGSYKIFGVIPAGDLGAHDADWEHVTARLSPDGSALLGVYYSAHRCYPHSWLRCGLV